MGGSCIESFGSVQDPTSVGFFTEEGPIDGWSLSVVVVVVVVAGVVRVVPGVTVVPVVMLVVMVPVSPAWLVVAGTLEAVGRC